MKVVSIQASTLLGEPVKNRIQLEGYVREALQLQADVIVFPETWNVGFIPRNVDEMLCEEGEDESLAWMKAIAQKYAVNLVGGSIAVKNRSRTYNRCYVINRAGQTIHTYDKMHLFSPGKEADYFTAGTQNEPFELEGVPCGVQICYDLRFPELTRKLAVAGIKVLFVPAQWPHPREEHWVTLNRARAIENQLFVVAVNGCGTAGDVVSCGRSLIFDPLGNALVQADERPGIFSAELDLNLVEHVRNKIPVFADRRPDLYN